jgi:hypothetical protein
MFSFLLMIVVWVVALNGDGLSTGAVTDSTYRNGGGGSTCAAVSGGVMPSEAVKQTAFGVSIS